MAYYLAPSLAKLYRDEINEIWPNRDRGSDGWVGDTSHAARKSDHNPDYDSGGVIRAVDIDKDGIDVPRLLKEVIGDPRVWYVIYNRTIWSRTFGWSARAYTGSNPHTSHIHISIRHSSEAENDTRNWFGALSPAPTKPPQEEDVALSEADKKWLMEKLPWHLWAKEIGGGDNRHPARMHLLWSSNSSREIKGVVQNQSRLIREAVHKNVDKAEIEEMLNNLDATIELIVTQPPKDES